eukprot:gene29654-26515_t
MALWVADRAGEARQVAFSALVAATADVVRDALGMMLHGIDDGTGDSSRVATVFAEYAQAEGALQAQREEERHAQRHALDERVAARRQRKAAKAECCQPIP